MQLTRRFFRDTAILLVGIVSLEAVVTLISGDTPDFRHLLRWVVEIGVMLTVWEAVRKPGAHDA